MRAELLTSDKVKITFESDDLELLNINYRDMDYRNEKVQRIFWRAIYFAGTKQDLIQPASSFCWRRIRAETEGLCFM